MLGPPEVRVGGELVRLETRKATAILAYVAIEGPQRRDVLDALLWPDSDAHHARGALRRTLSAIRRELPMGSLADGSDDVALGTDITVDHDVVETALVDTDGDGTPDLDLLRRADSAHRGRFLEGMELRDAALFDHWRATMEERVRRRHASVLERLCRAHMAAGALGEAVDTAERRLALDPLHEPSHQQLMLLHTWRGDRARASAQYRTCVRVLDEELGVGPLERTEELHRAILDGRAPAPRATPADHAGAPADDPASSATARPGTLPMVGRDGPLQRLRDLRAAAAHGGGAVAIRGEPGIGKTRLLEGALADARHAGGRTVLLRAQPGERTVAYAPLLHPLRALVRAEPGPPQELRSEAGRLVPDVAPPGELAPLASPAARTRFLDAITRILLGGVRGEPPGVLAVDDLDMADAETQELLGYLARRLADHPVLLLVTWRRGGEHEQRADGLLPAGTPTIDLERLSPQEVRALAHAAGADHDAEPLYGESEGVPYLVVSYLAARADHDDWELPSSGRDLVRARLAPLSDVATQVITAGAVLGRAFPLQTLEQVSGRGAEELVDASDELTARHLLAEVTSDDGMLAYAFTHDKIRVVVEHDTSLARRRLLHSRAADVRWQHELPVPAAVLAGHLAAAGRESEAAAAHAEAGRRAGALYANTEAAEHLQTAIGLGHPDAAQLLVELGDALVRLGRYRDAADRYTRAALRLADPAVVEHRLGSLRLREGDHVGARTHCQAALRAGPPLESEARIRADLALACLRAGDVAAATEEAEASLQLAETSDDRCAIARTRNLLAVISRRQGALAMARQHVQASLEVVDVDDDERVAALNTLTLVLLDAGEHDAAIATAREALEAGRAHGDRHHEAALLNNLADGLHASGRTSDALELQRQAAEAFAGVGDDPARHSEIWRLVDW